MEKRVLILDVDGTLRKLNLPASMETSRAVMKYLNHNPDRLFTDISSFRKWLKGDWWQDLISIGCTYDLFWKFSDKIFNKEIKPFPWVKKIITVLSSKNRFAALTSNSHSNIIRLLESEGLSSLFEITIGREHLKQFKPDPEGIHLIHKRMGGELSKYLIIGDTPHDFEAGKNAGIKTGLVKWGFAEIGLVDWQDLLALKPDYAFEEPEHLIETLC